MEPKEIAAFFREHSESEQRRLYVLMKYGISESGPVKDWADKAEDGSLTVLDAMVASVDS